MSAACICSCPQSDHTDGLGRCHGTWSNPVGTYPCTCEGFDSVGASFWACCEGASYGPFDTRDEADEVRAAWGIKSWTEEEQ